jgi:hypothetical protein
MLLIACGKCRKLYTEEQSESFQLVTLQTESSPTGVPLLICQDCYERAMYDSQTNLLLG